VDWVEVCKKKKEQTLLIVFFLTFYTSLQSEYLVGYLDVKISFRIRQLLLPFKRVKASHKFWKMAKSRL